MTSPQFLDEFWRDIDHDRVRPLADYQERYPEMTVEIAREYAAYLQARAQSDTPDPGADPGQAAPLPPAIGRYRILGLLEIGGMGEIYRAYDPELHREVALKTLRPHLSGDPRALARLHREARLAGKLEHPGLCPILDVQRDGDRTYVVMPLLKGETLQQHLDRARRARGDAEAFWSTLPAPGHSESTARFRDAFQRTEIGTLPAALLLLERIARAVHVAHEAGVLHRDLKPGNIMLQPDGTPVVLDFGLAKDVEEPAALTRTGEVMGSPSYMAPEQVAGDLTAVDARTDVYALGATMYEVLTLAPPYAGATTQALFAAILRGEPVPPRRRNRAIPRDVEAVCLQAMAVERARRYPTAQAFADDLANVRMLRPTTAKPLSTATRWLRRARRNPLVTTLIAVILLLLGVALGMWSHARRGRTLRGELAVAVQTVAGARLRGEVPPPDAVRVIETAVPEPGVREPFLRNPLDHRTKDALLRWALENLRAAQTPPGIVLLGPHGAIVDPLPWLRCRTGLPRDASWRLVARLENVDLNKTLAVRVEQPAHAADADTIFRPPTDQPLAPGAWRWSVEVDRAVHPEIQWPAGHGEFTVLPASAVHEIERKLVATGDDLLDRQLAASALLARGLAGLALERLAGDVAAIPRHVDRARHLLLRMRAFAVLGDRDGLEEAQRAWLLLAGAPEAQGTRRAEDLPK